MHEDFLMRVGVGRPAKPEKFWQRLEMRFGKLATDMAKIIDRRANGSADSEFWRLKNQDLDLSLWLSGQFMGDFYRTYLPWLSTAMASGQIRRILDVGCDNGVLTCSYAASFPDAQVLGIDQSHESIGCANELAGRLRQSNVEFRELSALELSTLLVGETFDLITATMTYHSVFEIPDMPTGCSLFQLKLPDAEKWRAALMQIPPLLGTDGRFISIERLTSSPGILWWAGTLKDAGLQIDWQSSDLLRYSSRGEGEMRLPAFVCNRHERCGASLVSDVLAFQARPELVELARTPFEGDIAEALFVAFRDRDLVWGLEIGHTEQAIERFEVWDARTVILAYTYSNLGSRRLVIGPCHKQQECIEHAKGFWKGQPGLRLRHYTSIVERDSL